MRLRSAAVGILSALAAAPAVAQTIRGTVLDDGSKVPVAAVLITLLDDAGTEVLPGVRTDSLGNFMVHAARTGTWRVRAIRIGYRPVTSDPVSLAVGELAVVRLRMTTVAQQLVPVQIVEQRQLSAGELMSTVGFDLRESRGQGRFLSGERLADMGADGVREVLATWFQPVLFVDNDAVLGDVLRIRQAMGVCVPEVYLDGKMLATTPEPGAIFDNTTPPATAIDSMRAQMRVDSDQSRVGFDQVQALSILASLAADELHGIEVYRANDLPPASLGAWFGMTRGAVRPCGTVAVWTKKGAQSPVTSAPFRMTGRPVQVIIGTLVDFETGLPVAGQAVALLTGARDPVGMSVVTDERGDFIFRTGRAGELRLLAGGSGYIESTTPAFGVSSNELVVVKFFLSASDGLLAPLGVSARVLPQDIGLTSLAGFTYRRERAQGGYFFGARDIAQSEATSISALVAGLEGVVVADSPAAATITFTRERDRTSCSPHVYLDGTLLTSGGRLALDLLPMDGIFGVELYLRESEIPGLFRDSGACGLIVIWSKR